MTTATLTRQDTTTRDGRNHVWAHTQHGPFPFLNLVIQVDGARSILTFDASIADRIISGCTVFEKGSHDSRVHDPEIGFAAFAMMIGQVA